METTLAIAAMIWKHIPLRREGHPVLSTLIVVLIVLWALGLFTGYAFGGLIHVLLVVALIAVIFRVLSGRRIA